mmetsp:Transcript_13912/g.31860  ORF Transcript_13912/g.31860 Transcript_13912/m.31860 type:complete len:212 (-) Transcript_13912:155-790(-)
MAPADATAAAEEEAGSLPKEPEKQELNKGDLTSVKYALDDVVADVVTEAGYPRDDTASNVRILLSLIVCLTVPASHFLPSYVEENHAHLLALGKNTVVFACLAVYALGSVSMAAFAYLYEKDAILITKQKKGAFSSSGLRVTTNIERFDDMYKITLAPVTYGQQFERDPMDFEKSITQWIDVNGVVAEEVVRKDVSKFLKSYEKSAYKKTK